ncbi:MAG TPA: sigma-70 family RNA polymerase sigma factor [Fimbriimonadaceae bacterium]|nr:sigma-70 family RNA polymerase sigma factor [Fimbriimonadaceae bacterium]
MDPSRFEALVLKHKDSIYCQMARVCGHREDAEDALANALLLAFKASAKLTSEKAFRSWLCIIAKRVCLRMRSHPSFRATMQYAEEHDLLSSDAKELELVILKRCVNEAIEALPKILVSVYRLCELDEKSVIEAASELGISPAATKSRLLRARKLVRDHLDNSICGQ